MFDVRLYGLWFVFLCCWLVCVRSQFPFVHLMQIGGIHVGRPLAPLSSCTFCLAIIKSQCCFHSRSHSQTTSKPLFYWLVVRMVIGHGKVMPITTTTILFIHLLYIDDAVHGSIYHTNTIYIEMEIMHAAQMAAATIAAIVADKANHSLWIGVGWTTTARVSECCGTRIRESQAMCDSWMHCCHIDRMTNK